MRLAPCWLSGYAGVILLVTILVNLATQLARNTYGLTLPSMEASLGLSHFQAGSLITSGALLLMVASLTFGFLASHYGSRMIVGTAGIVAGLAMVFLGNASGFLVAILMSGLIGFASGACTTPAMGLLSVWFDSRNRGAVAGLAATGGGVSFVVVGALAPWLTGRDPDDGWRHTWSMLGAVVMATGVLSLVFLRDHPKEGQGLSEIQGKWPIAVYTSRLVWLMSFLAFCSGWCTGLYTTFFGIYLEEQQVSLPVIGRLWMLLGLLGIGSGLLWGTLSDRLGRRAGFLLSFIAYGIGGLLFWASPVLAGFIASVVLVGISFRASYVICAAAAGDYVDPRFSAAAFGLMGVGAGLGQATGPLLGGYIADVTETASWVFVLTVGGAAAAIFGAIFLRQPSSSR